MDLRSGERMDDLGRNGLRIIQHPERFPFSLDAVLLAHFATVRPGDRVLDLGTGCAVIPLLLAGLYPTVQAVGLEIQADTCDMARRSVLLNGLQDRIRIVAGDYRRATDLLGHEQFDLVTVNPPYYRPGSGKISPTPHRGVARHEVEGTLEEVVASAARTVRYRGRVAVVFLAERLVDLLAVMRQHRLEPKRLRLIHPKSSHPAKLVLVEALKGGGTGLVIGPPLMVYGVEGKFSQEMRAIYGEGPGPSGGTGE